GKRMVFFGGPDGWCYAFEGLEAVPAPAHDPALLRTVWKFDCDPAAPKQDINKYVGNRRVSPSEIMGMPVFDKGRVYVTAGGGRQGLRRHPPRRVGRPGIGEGEAADQFHLRRRRG